MNTEIERKYLVKKELWAASNKPKGLPIKQSYLSTHPDKTIRIRTIGEKALLTIKGRMIGLTRPEYEYEIPLKEAQEMIELFGEKLIEKTRFLINFEGKTWEVDVFEGENEGLIVAEIELESEEEAFESPTWVGQEVSTDIRYFNSNLQDNPFTKWKIV